MMNKQSGSVAKSFLKKETLLLGLITFLIYGSVYFYERGVAYALHIPFDFIIINITTISDDFISFYLYLFPLLTASSALLLWSGRHQGKKAIAHFLICGFYVLLSWVVMSKNINDVMFSIFNSGIILYLLNKWFPFKNEEAASQSQSPIRYFGENLIDVAAFLFVFANTFVGLGRGSVVNDEYTTFLKDGNEYAIVKVYDENMFVWKVKNEMILRELTYFKLDDVSKEVFTRKILKSK